MQPPTDYRESHLDKGHDYDIDLVSNPFDAYLSHWEAHYLRRWLQAHAEGLPPRALDFACGTGRITHLLKPYVKGGITGVDVSSKMLQVARMGCHGVNFIETDLTQPPPTGTYTSIENVGLITAFRFFGNAQPELRRQALQALVPRLAQGGRLVIDHHRNAGATYARLDRLTGGNANGMDLTLGGLLNLLRGMGLQVETVMPIGAWLWRSSLLHRAPWPPEVTGCQPYNPAAHARAKWWERLFHQAPWAHLAPASIIVARHAG